MILKTKNGYQVKSEKGKPLSQDDLTLQQAKERLKEVELLKDLKKWAKSKGMR